IEGRLEGVELVFKIGYGAQNFVSVLLKNMTPEDGVSCRNACGIGEAVSSESAPALVLVKQLSGKHGGEYVGEVADIGHNLVVLLGAYGVHAHIEILPESDYRFNGGEWGFFDR